MFTTVVNANPIFEQNVIWLDGNAMLRDVYLRQWTGTLVVQVVNGLSYIQRQGNTWTNDELLSIWILRTFVNLKIFSLTKMHLIYFK